MPGLVFRRRRLLLGGDELMLPYATCACGRTGWVLFLLVGLGATSNMLLSNMCHDIGYLAFAYELTSIIVGAFSLFIEIRIAQTSTYGTIIDPGPRNELIAKYLSHKTVLSTLQLILGLCGVALVIYIPFVPPCGESLALITSGLVLTSISQFLDAGGMYCCFLAFTTSDSIWIHRDEDDDEEGEGGAGGVAPRHGMLSDVEMKYEEFCRTACKWAAWCSCTFNVFRGGEQEADFAHVSRVFGRMLSARRYMDVVPTDIAAGLILLRHVQKAEDYKRRDELMGSGSGGSNSRRGGSGPSASAGAIVTDPGLADTPFHGFGTPPASSARPSLGGDETLKRVPDGQNEGSTFLIAGGSGGSGCLRTR